jgi:hypothetical protein
LGIDSATTLLTRTAFPKTLILAASFGCQTNTNKPSAALLWRGQLRQRINARFGIAHPIHFWFLRYATKQI